MRIAIISLSNIYLTPYINKYKQEVNAQMDLIYWDRHNIEETLDNINLIPFKLFIPENSSKITKLRGYFHFRRFAIKRLKSGNYDGVILLQSIIGVLLSLFILKKYKKKYILDIRDYTYEMNKIYFTIEKKIIENSFFTAISSSGFKHFLPAYDYVLTHNITFIDKKLPQKTKESEKIVISYIGLIRFLDICMKTIDIFKNDDRFILKFIGEGSQLLTQYCEINQVDNVVLIERFKPEETIDLYNDASIIYNLYGNSTPLVRYALSNKLYYAAQLVKPIAVQSDTYMAQISKEFNFGIEFNLEHHNLPDEIFEQYHKMNFEKMNFGCKIFLTQIKEDEEKYYQKIRDFEECL
jgi:hypothetical protein